MHRHLLPLLAAFACCTPAQGATDKVLVPHSQPSPAGYERLADYGAFALYRGEGSLNRIAGARKLDRADVLEFERQHVDTTTEGFRAPGGFNLEPPTEAALHVVQFIGPIKDEWLQQLRDLGAEPVHYVANYGYLVWVDAQARAKLETLVATSGPLQFSAPLPSFIKLGKTLAEAFQSNAPGDRLYTVTVQRYRTAGDGRQRITATGMKAQTDWQPVLDFENARFTGTLNQIRQAVELPDVYWVGEFLPREMMDEVQAQIVRGHFNGDQSGPASEGYLPWLQGLGFSQNPADYPVLDITDDGIGNMTTTPPDPTLYVDGSTSNPTRLAFVQNCGVANPTPGVHGHINTNIAGGFDLRTNQTTPGARFPAEYQRGMGMNPWARLAGTRIFSPSYNVSGCGGTDQGVIAQSWQSGARISSNSWGCSGCAGSYDEASQAYDVGVRDADLNDPGTQQFIVLFSAGNSGPSAASLGTPGNGKNMITVGASENARPVDENGNWTDGCQVPPSGADNAMDVIDFSSRGPAPGGRTKPEVIAPGTHITGTKPVPNDGDGACDISRPLGNPVFAASSGTSHSTPAVAGVASLAYWWIQNDQGNLTFDGGVAAAPSPALMKAWLMAHPTYLTGVDGNDTLPSNNQGYGMPNLGDMFDTSAKFLVDQTQLMTASGQEWTWSGAAADPSEPVRIAFAYTDEAGAIGVSPQVNNLDLEVEADGVTYLGNRFAGQWSTTGGNADSLNNYEAAFFPPGQASAIQIRVIAANVAGDGVPGNGDATDQDFAIVCSNCVQEPGFSLAVAPTSQSICTPDDAVYGINVGSILGYTSQVTLSVAGEPAGTSVGFDINPVTPPGSSLMTIGNTGAATFGNYQLTVTGTSIDQTREVIRHLSVFTGTPLAPAPQLPANNSINVGDQPLLSWSSVDQGVTYRVELATDPAFTNVIIDTSLMATQFQVPAPLQSNTTHYWRVTSDNICGPSPMSAVFQFKTAPAPGDCNDDQTLATLFSEDFGNGLNGFATTGSTGQSTWAISAKPGSPSGGNTVQAQDINTVSDQRLISPSIALPSGQSPLTLQFWNDQTLEDRTGGCYDGGILEISTNNGVSWTQLGDAALMVGAYDGPISSGYSNPLADLDAWCGRPRPWEKYIVDLDDYAGQNVRFRWRLGTDTSVGLPDGWHLDDIKVQSCASDNDLIFADDFEL